MADILATSQKWMAAPPKLPTKPAAEKPRIPATVQELLAVQAGGQYRYFSGTDVSVYFGDYLVEEAVNIQWQLAENILPTYGYNRYTYRRVAKGTRLVQGTMTLNLTDPEEIALILDRALGQSAQKVLDSQLATVKTDPRLGRSVTQVTGKEININDIIKSTDVAQQKKELQNYFWGEVRKSVESSGSSNVPRLGPRTRGAMVRSTWFGFPITLVYDKKDMDYENMDLAIQQMFLSNPTAKKSVATETITNCHLTNLSRAIDDSGQAITSVITFLGADVVPGWLEVSPQLSK